MSYTGREDQNHSELAQDKETFLSPCELDNELWAFIKHREFLKSGPTSWNMLYLIQLRKNPVKWDNICDINVGIIKMKSFSGICNFSMHKY
jgi:hypothetical protein